MPVFRKNNTPLEELYSIKQIFGYEIEPDIEKAGINFLDNYVHLSIVVSANNSDRIVEQNLVSIKLSIKFPKLYPQDLPELALSCINGLSKQDVNEILQVIKELCVRLCGRSMLMDIILKIEDHIKYQIYKNPDEKKFEKTNKTETLSETLPQATSPILICTPDATINEKESCVDEILNIIKNIPLSSSYTIPSIKFQLGDCTVDHCGVFYTHGVQCSDNFASYFFRIWKFSDFNHKNIKESIKGKDFMERSLLNIVENINMTKPLIHKNISSSPKAFIYNNLNDFYLFLGTPIDSHASIPICKYLESLMAKVSEKTFYTIIKQILNGLHFLHEQNIIHGCLYPCNVLITSDLTVSIQDSNSVCKVWGLWKDQQQLSETRESYIKLHHFEKYSQYVQHNLKGDIFHFGLIILSLCECRIYDTFPISVPEIFNSKFEDFIRCCIEYSERARYTTHELLKHLFIVNYRPTESIWMGSIADHTHLTVQNSSLGESSESESRLLKEFELIQVIGKGAFGVVILAKNRIDSCIYAVKRIIVSEKDMNERMKLIKEVQILSRLTHPNIVRYYNSWVEYKNADWFAENVSSGESDEESEEESDDELKSDYYSSVDIVFTDNLASNSQKSQITPKSRPVKNEAPNPGIVYVYMQMEYCEKKSLREVIDNSAVFQNDKCIWQFFRDICSGLAYIHSQGMIHRDIKPENILISSIDNAKIVDFNLSTIGLFNRPVFEFAPSHFEKDPASSGSHTNISRVGTFPYIAPEIEFSSVPSIPITSKIDMYSFGVVFFEMCHPPFFTKSERYEVIKDLKRKLLIPKISDTNKISIIESLLQKDPRSRMSANDLLMTSLYPTPIEDININKVVQHLTSEPLSPHSRKILNTFFIHDHNTDIKNSYLDDFFHHSPETAISNTWNRNCAFKYLNHFLKIRGCIDLTAPTFVPFHHKNVFSKQSSLCFVDSYGVRLCLNTHFLPHIFQFFAKLDSNEVRILPVSRFGGVNRVYVNETESSFNHHPLTQFEFHYAHVGFSHNITECLTECIVETMKVVSNLQTANLPKDLDPRMHANYQELLFKSGLVDEVVVHINHVQLLLFILRKVGIKNEDDLSYILYKLSKISLIDDLNNRATLLGSLFNERTVLINKKQILTSILLFQGSLHNLNILLFKIFKTKLDETVNSYVQSLSGLFQSISSFLPNIKNVVINLGLYNNSIWPADCFLFQFIGLQTISEHIVHHIILSNGGVFSYAHEHAKFYDNIIVGPTKENKNININFNNDGVLDVSNLRIAYSSTPCKPLIELSRFLHVNRSCFLSNVDEVVHDLVLVCYNTSEQNNYDMGKLQSFADFLRSPSYNFSVYVYYHPFTFETIRRAMTKLSLINVAAFACFSPQDMTVKLFFIEKNAFVEVIAQDSLTAAIIMMKRIKKSSSVHEKTLVHDQKSKSVKNLDIKFLYVDQTYSQDLRKKYQTLCIQKLDMVASKFNTNIRFIVIMADILIDEFFSLITDLSLDYNQIETSIINCQRKSSSSKIKAILQLIKENLEPRNSDAIYCLYNIQSNRFKPLI